MDLKWCECNLQVGEPTYNAVGYGDAMLCSKCDGFIVCDFCKLESSSAGNFPLALTIIGHHFVCDRHGWLGIASNQRRPNSN